MSCACSAPNVWRATRRRCCCSSRAMPHRFAQRLWAEQASGLLLRADVLGARGEVLESASFSDVVIGGKPNPELVLHAMRKLDGYRIVRPAATRTQLDAEGWSVAHSVPGFQLVACMRRELGAMEEPPTSASTSGADGGVLRWPDPRVGVRRAVRRPAPQAGGHQPGCDAHRDDPLAAIGGSPRWATCRWPRVQLFSSALERRR